MTSFEKKTKIIIYSALACGAVCAVLRTLCLLFFYDFHIGYYTSGAILPIISNSLFGIFALLLLLLPFALFKKDATLSFEGGRMKYFALPVAIVFLLPAIDAAMALSQAAGVISLLTLVAAAGSAAFFAMLALSRSARTDLTVVAGVCSVVYLALCWLRSYTDFLVPMNSPDKILFNLACVGAALLIIGELRVLCSSARPRAYLCYLSLSILSLFAYALPRLIETVLTLPGAKASTLAESLVLLALLIYACAKALTVKAQKAPDATPDTNEEE